MKVKAYGVSLATLNSAAVRKRFYDVLANTVCSELYSVSRTKQWRRCWGCDTRKQKAKQSVHSPQF